MTFSIGKITGLTSAHTTGEKKSYEVAFEFICFDIQMWDLFWPIVLGLVEQESQIFGKFKTPKSNSEINWPLTGMENLIWFMFGHTT